MILLIHGIKKIDSKKVERNTSYQRLDRVQEQEGWIKAWSMGTELQLHWRTSFGILLHRMVTLNCTN